MHMKLYKHQQDSVDNAPNKWGLWFRMRVGKTPTAIRLVTSRCKSALIICPKGLVKQWENEIDIWSDNKDVIFTVISREQFKKRCTILERMWRKKKIKYVSDCSLPPMDAVVIDEVHRGFGNYKSMMFKCLEYYLKNNDIEYRWLLSGTPFTATSWSVFSYGKIFGKKKRDTDDDWDWFAWNKWFFDMIQMGKVRVPIAKKGMETTLQDLLRNMGTVIDLKDVAEIAEDVDVFEYFKLNKKQNDEIVSIDEDVAAVEYCKIHQLEQGALNSDKYKEELNFPCAKDERLIVLAANYEKLIIVCKYKAQIRKVIKLFENRKTFVIWGESKQGSAEIANLAEKEKNCIVIIQGDTCDGYSLKSFDTMVFASMSYSFVNYDQIRSRMKSMDKKTPNTYIHLLTQGESLDAAVKENIDKKQTFSFELYAKRRSNIPHQAKKLDKI